MPHDMLAMLLVSSEAVALIVGESTSVFRGYARSAAYPTLVIEHSARDKLSAGFGDSISNNSGARTNQTCLRFNSWFNLV